jgi:hypothetical protein
MKEEMRQDVHRSESEKEPEFARLNEKGEIDVFFSPEWKAIEEEEYAWYQYQQGRSALYQGGDQEDYWTISQEELEARVDVWREELMEKKRVSEENLRKKLEKLVEEVYEGKMGRGRFAVQKIEDVLYLIRVIPVNFIQPQLQHQAPKREKRRDDFNSIEIKGVLGKSDDVELFSSSLQREGDCSFHVHLPEFKDRVFSDVEQFSKWIFFLEVQYSATQDELWDFYNLLKEKRWTLKEIKEVFYADFQVKESPGEMFYFGGCDDHVGYQFILPTGRFAVLLYSNEEEQYTFYGVTGDYDMEPAWSSKHGPDWNRHNEEEYELQQPNEEEMAFLAQYNEYAALVNEPIIDIEVINL